MNEYKEEEILCIHYYFPPIKTSAVVRNYKIAKTFCDFFSQVHILTSDNHTRFPNQDRPFPDNLSLDSIYTLDYRRLFANKNEDTHIAVKKKKSKFFLWLLKVQKAFPFNLFLFEGNLIYIFGAYSKAKKKINQGNVTTIYSSFGPYADHYVSYLLKRKFPHLRWIADFRDLQVEPIYKNVIWKPLQQWMERKVLARADKVTSISQGLTDQLSIYDRPTQSIPRGVEVREQTPQFDKFTISYTGSLFFDYRDPRPFFESIRDLIDLNEMEANDIQIIYAGRDGAQFEEWAKEVGVHEVLCNKKMIEEHEAKAIQNKSHINLLLTSSSAELQGVITGKVFEYLEAGNPILCLINGVEDLEFEALFSELEAGQVVYQPERVRDRMRQFILSNYKQWKSTNSVQPTINKSLLKSQFSWNFQVEKMLRM